MNKFYIYRNHTVEHLFKGFDVSYSGYDDILSDPLDANWLVWFYMPKIGGSNEVLEEEVESYFQRLQLLLNNNAEKKILVFLLSARMIKQFSHNDTHLEEAITRFNQKVISLSRLNPLVQFIDIDQFFTNYALTSLTDWKFYHISQILISPKLAKDFKVWFTKRISGLINKRKKCLVLDLDNTLWGGVVGEDGVSGISIGDTYPGNAFMLFQENLIEAGKNGIILTVCSKNNEIDIEEVWNKNPFIKLNKDHLSAFRINWKNKAINITEIAAELNIALDSIVFIDDNPAERMMVKQTLPDVTVPDFPDEPYEMEVFFRKVMEDHFQIYSLTNEDKNKTRQYKENSNRKSAASAAVDMDSFLTDLDMVLKVHKGNDFSLDRIASMTQKTNQFNLTTRRYTSADVKSFIDKGSLVYCLSVKDKFGDNGITVATIVHKDGNQGNIDSFLLSCRILGRGIEVAFMKYMLNQLYADGINEVSAVFIPSKKNVQTKDFYEKLGFNLVEEVECGTKRYNIDLQHKLNIKEYYKFI
tara:strand:+ start:1480 stop:3063 length:1584 start_codon:yes stop_codon:yes gene_type:complete